MKAAPVSCKHFLSFSLNFREGNNSEIKNNHTCNWVFNNMKVYWVALKLSSVSDGCWNNLFFFRFSQENWEEHLDCVIILL